MWHRITLCAYRINEYSSNTSATGLLASIIKKEGMWVGGFDQLRSTISLALVTNDAASRPNFCSLRNYAHTDAIGGGNMR